MKSKKYQSVTNNTALEISKGKDTVSYFQYKPEEGMIEGVNSSSAVKSTKPVWEGVEDYTHTETGKSIIKDEDVFDEVELLSSGYPPIDIYFYEMSAMLSPALKTDPSDAIYNNVLSKYNILQSGASVLKNTPYAWRYRSINFPTHDRLSYDVTGHWSIANPFNGVMPQQVGVINAVWDARYSIPINNYTKQAVANGITYHTETSWGHYVRNCPHFCWPCRVPLANGVMPAEGLMFEMIPFAGDAQQTPRTNPELAIPWAALQRMTDQNGAPILPAGIVPTDNSEASKALRKRLRERYKDAVLKNRITAFYEHRSSTKQSTQDALGSWWWRRYISDKTRAPVNMQEFSLYDIRLLADLTGGYGANEYWTTQYNMTEQFKYWMSTPLSWTNYPKTPVPENETPEQAIARQQKDWQEYLNACKKGARPGRVVRIQLNLPPGRYVPKIYSQTCSYSWFPLDLSKRKGDHTMNGQGHNIDKQMFGSSTAKLSDGSYYPFMNPVDATTVANTSPTTHIGRGGMDFWKHKGNTNITVLGIDQWNVPIDEKDLDLDWWDLFKVTEGVGDGFYKNSPVWQTPAWEAKPLSNMNKNCGFNKGNNPGGGSGGQQQSDKHTINDTDYSSNKLVHGDIEANDKIGKEVPYFTIDITEEKRPKEIHFFAASRGTKWVEVSLGGILGTTQLTEAKWSFGPTNKDHVRIKGAQSIANQLHYKWTTQNFWTMQTALMPTVPNALAWIIEIVYWDGSRASYTVWCKESLAPFYLTKWYGTQNPDIAWQQQLDDQTQAQFAKIWG
jgi:hypothetical protein